MQPKAEQKLYEAKQKKEKSRLSLRRLFLGIISVFGNFFIIFKKRYENSVGMRHNFHLCFARINKRPKQRTPRAVADKAERNLAVKSSKYRIMDKSGKSVSFFWCVAKTALRLIGFFKTCAGKF